MFSRRLVHVSAIALWSIATLYQASCGTFECMLVSRILVGVGQAFNAPCAYMTIAALFPVEKRSTANGLYSTGTYLGAGLSSLSLMMALNLGWRMVSAMAGVVGLLAAISVYFSVSEEDILAATSGISAKSIEGPYNGTTDMAGEETDELHSETVTPDEQRQNNGVMHAPIDNFSKMLSPMGTGAAAVSSWLNKAASQVSAYATPNPRGTPAPAALPPGDQISVDPAKEGQLLYTLGLMLQDKIILMLIAATCLRMMATYSHAAFVPIFYRREFPHEIYWFSELNAWGTCITGLLSSYYGGVLADKYAALDPGYLAWVPAIGAAISAPLNFLALYSTSFNASLGFMLLATLFSECWLGPGMTILQRQLPSGCQGVAVSFLIFANTVFASVGPHLIAHLDPGTLELRKDIAAVICTSLLLAAAVFYRLGQQLQKQRSYFSYSIVNQWKVGDNTSAATVPTTALAAPAAAPNSNTSTMTGSTMAGYGATAPEPGSDYSAM
eukprot:CAMPEP_0113938068 /NCGR_PEP_ID=MMETSP1339-20121228/4488_1 /TAXON_ID=94617 /ORGANISM="Fibrocapsa japonica" /LENGTH=497 /DNA_ID=CAMNT_0000941003 /DNA_START=447 /DNA_END=1940 /DNA_ORIENTATION=+ /assembly_acc=CAM_ASM_000762